MSNKYILHLRLTTSLELVSAVPTAFLALQEMMPSSSGSDPLMSKTHTPNSNRVWTREPMWRETDDKV